MIHTMPNSPFCDPRNLATLKQQKEVPWMVVVIAFKASCFYPLLYCHPAATDINQCKVLGAVTVITTNSHVS